MVNDREDEDAAVRGAEGAAEGHGQRTGEGCADDINSIDDIVKLPFTTKYDLRDNYPFGLCAVPMSQFLKILKLHRYLKRAKLRYGNAVTVDILW